jgi:hypothetical protein
MAAGLKRIIPDGQTLLAMSPEELAGAILLVLQERIGGHPQVNLFNFMNALYQREPVYQDVDRNLVARAVSEALQWMITNGLLVRAPRENNPDWMMLSRRAIAINNSNKFDAFRKAAAFPRSLLHPLIGEKCWANLLRGDFETAVFGFSGIQGSRGSYP